MKMGGGDLFWTFSIYEAKLTLDSEKKKKMHTHECTRVLHMYVYYGYRVVRLNK